MDQWASVFEHIYSKNKGAGKQELKDFLSKWNTPLSPDEIAEVNQNQINPFPRNDPLYQQYKPFDPGVWSFPQRELPPDYIRFLQEMNGGEMGSGERHFQFFSTESFREYNVAYQLAEYMPGVVTFGMDGCGNHYVFDMRNDMEHCEYPILAVQSGNLGFDDCVQVAASFQELCQGTTSVDKEL